MMEMIFHSEPLLFQEAAELLYLYHNKLSIPEPASRKRPYAIPTSQLQSIIDGVRRCQPMDRDALEFFFRQHPVPGGQNTCLGRVLAFTCAGMSCSGAADGTENIVRYMHQVRQQGLVFSNLSIFTLDTSAADAGIAEHGIPQPFRGKLLRVYEAPEAELAALRDLLGPVMSYLSKELLPWTSMGALMLEAWEEKMRSVTLERFFAEQLHLEGVPPVERIEVGALYLAPLWVTFGLEEPPPTMKIFVGTGVGTTWEDDPSELMGWEYRALQILSNPDRFRMIKAMSDRPMSSREMSKELGLHLGTVTRDVNNMNAAYLLNVIQQGSRRRYSLNHQALRTLAKHLLSLCPEEE